MTDEERKAKNNARQREYYRRNRDKILAWWKDYRTGRGRDAVLESARRTRERIANDPDRYARMMERRHTPEYRAKNIAYCRAWRSAHKKRYVMGWRLRNDRRRFYCSIDPDYYAKYRKDNRVRAAVLRRKRGTVKSAYIPQLSRRIPDTCRYGRVLDTRSVFLWNNLPAASLVAGRAYRAMQWREIHCDRYGQVCR